MKSLTITFDEQGLQALDAIMDLALRGAGSRAYPPFRLLADILSAASQQAIAPAQPQSNVTSLPSADSEAA